MSNLRIALIPHYDKTKYSPARAVCMGFLVVIYCEVCCLSVFPKLEEFDKSLIMEYSAFQIAYGLQLKEIKQSVAELLNVYGETQELHCKCHPRYHV